MKAGRQDIINALDETADPQQQFSLRSSMGFWCNLEPDAGERWDNLRNNHGATRKEISRSFYRKVTWEF